MKATGHAEGAEDELREECEVESYEGDDGSERLVKVSMHLKE